MRPSVVTMVLACLAAPAAAQQPHMHGAQVADAPWYGQVKTPEGGSCCNDRDCRASTYCSTHQVADGVVVDGHCVPLPVDRLVPPPPDVALAPDEVHVCATTYYDTGTVRIWCVVGGFGT